MYAKLIDGTLQPVPKTYTLQDGRIVSNYHLSDESVFLSDGYKPVNLESSPPDNINNYKPVYAETATEITIEHWDLQPPTVNSEAIAAILFVKSAASGEIDEANLLEHQQLFAIWNQNWTGKQGDIVQDEGSIYRSIHNVGAGQNTKPSVTPSMWTRIGNPAEEFPEWFQPVGSHDAYQTGDKVSYDNKHFISTANGNVWQPGVYGWLEV
jgi:hypothetical protein